MTTEVRQTMLDHARNLLVLAQYGDTIAEEQLIVYIRDNFMKWHIGRYLSRNRQIENEDLKQEFMIGVALAIPRAKIDVGDPIMYCINQGVYRVRTALRSNILKNTMQVCNDCGNKSRLNQIERVYICKKCGSKNVSTYEVNDHDDIFLENIVSTGEFEDDVQSSMLIEEFEETLTAGTNVHNLFILLRDGINRDNPEIKNYIRTIANIWGGCSDNNVIQAMDKLKMRITKFYADKGFTLKNGYTIMIERSDTNE